MLPCDGHVEFRIDLVAGHAGLDPSVYGEPANRKRPPGLSHTFLSSGSIATQETNDAVRDSLGCFGKRVMLGEGRVGRQVEASHRALDEARLLRATEVVAGKAVRGEIAYARDPGRFGQGGHAFDGALALAGHEYECTVH